MDKSLIVEVLQPPEFSKTGRLVPRTEAWQKGLWYGTFNLWIVTSNPEPCIIYQQRSPTIGWAPGKLDVALAGHYENGETIDQAINHEGLEELKISYKFSNLTSIGRRLNVGIGTDGTMRNSVSDLFLIQDNRPFDQFQPQEDEVFALCVCPLQLLLRVHKDPAFEFTVEGKRHDGKRIEIKVNQDIFPYNWDNYHYKMALLIDRYFKGEKELIY